MSPLGGFGAIKGDSKMNILAIIGSCMTSRGHTSCKFSDSIQKGWCGGGMSTKIKKVLNYKFRTLKTKFSKCSQLTKLEHN